MMGMQSTQAPQAASNPRKRKKRAPAPGAAVDCFTCTERHLPCDRKRPFCSQCLDSGRDCSGYKTQLTWDVGVASRGKLRGLSLPVAGTKKVSTATSLRDKKRKESTASQPHSVPPQFYQSTQAPLISPLSTSPGTSPKSFSSTSPAKLWEAPSSHLPTTTQVDEVPNHVPQSISSDAPVVTSADQPECIQSFAFQTNIWDSHPQAIGACYPIPSPSPTIPTPGPERAPNIMYFDDNHSYAQNPPLVSPTQTTFVSDHRSSFRDDAGIPRDGISMLLHAGQSVALSNSENTKDDEEFTHDLSDEPVMTDEFSLLPMTQPFSFDFPMPASSGIYGVGKTPRIQYLINYYAEVISPVIVAFDGPSNPFRTHILQLAAKSETLQHAISALAASNLRQRKGIGLLSTGKTAPARRSSFAHVHLSSEYSQGILSPEEQMREETLHKRLAVSQLNQQLAHPVLRKDDSILATLLILCLFHICDSGVAKFQTQFAGVRKLLALRGDDVRLGNDDSRWMSRLFTWFDSLAATVNDREGQITGSFLDVPALYGDWSLENIAGIDSRLFKIIARLGQLNLLRQGKSTATAWQVSRPLVQLPPTTASFASVDGNGCVSSDRSGMRGQFWKEWQDIKHELLAWQLDTTLFDTVSKESSCLTAEQRMDLDSISQSFRYSALLYLQRLASPDTPSRDESIQVWVRQSLIHIKKVQSDVYLLWPLFITGSECIDDESRDLIRGRCIDIQKDSGFVNNASCLQLLEKVWSVGSPNSSPRSKESNSRSADQPLGSAFRFRDVMVREAAKTEGEGEYIVV